ncbi:Cell wall assembly/cell proliferation coordinating protein, KNR4-like protein [Paenibacillus curdlanolyticus YK9]|uniref:Cell wall assembly/cell proliferation coordinating protein, KNR4-like protein n=1 Tax=Paenibacillus curdlanolyticus YK9 TaxID=717606 RepID=E0IFL1_9BACL|nr:SMI1/KNR4 family protein [Paenibacillus curdlanolyticus]EFM08677.1 Cell wall assembly/cell proliferation coordinating protein, KNR4-like protein [Paenibacillus curdlanolyticus YK9]
MIRKLIEQLEKRDDCNVYPVATLPVLQNEKHELPQDLLEFYEVCGGVELFTEADFRIRIVPPEKFVLANPVIVGELCAYDHLSSNWYIIGEYGGEYITIDLWKSRLGRCYDSFFDRHGSVGNCDIVARSFTELIIHLIDNGGKSLYWTEDDFEYLGDAYDDC